MALADKPASDRLQPALLDRLSRVPPKGQVDPPEHRSLSKGAFRDAVLRDLRWLLNSTKPTVKAAQADDWSGRPPGIDWTGRPHARHSVLNYGVASLAGETASTLDSLAIAASVRRAILDFEPRIAPNSLKVEVQVSNLQMAHHNVIGMVISGTVWAQPKPLDMNLRTELNLETGQVEIEDLGR